jgi:3-phosphoshikimate 1-carboxyvinyltransferase
MITASASTAATVWANSFSRARVPPTDVDSAQIVEPATRVAGELRVPGDKSIAHRALMLAALAQGESRIAGLPEGEDVAATVACLRSLAVNIERTGGPARVHGRGWRSFSPPHGPLDCANSGTTMRLMLGILAGSWVSATLDGDASLRRRPMARVVDPLRMMGAKIESQDGRAPLTVTGTRLQGRRHVLPVPSAQVKSALLLAGLSASGPTSVVEAVATRDHTERLLRAMGTDVHVAAGVVEVRPSHQPLRPLDLSVPGDFSSAAFWMAAAALRPGWSVTIREVGLNPSRTAFLHLLESMGAEIHVDAADAGVEPLGAVTVRGRRLRAITIGAADVAAAIDEIPALLSVATQAEGTTVIEGAAELRVKESDRLATMSQGLRRMGANVDERADGVSIRGQSILRGATVDPHGDHRIAMALAVAGLAASGPTTIEGADCIAVSYPDFFADLQGLAK